MRSIRFHKLQTSITFFSLLRRRTGGRGSGRSALPELHHAVHADRQDVAVAEGDIGVRDGRSAHERDGVVGGGGDVLEGVCWRRAVGGGEFIVACWSSEKFSPILLR